MTDYNFHLDFEETPAAERAAKHAAAAAAAAVDSSSSSSSDDDDDLAAVTVARRGANDDENEDGDGSMSSSSSSASSSVAVRTTTTTTARKVSLLPAAPSVIPCPNTPRTADEVAAAKARRAARRAKELKRAAAAAHGAHATRVCVSRIPNRTCAADVHALFAQIGIDADIVSVVNKWGHVPPTDRYKDVALVTFATTEAATTALAAHGLVMNGRTVAVSAATYDKKPKQAQGSRTMFVGNLAYDVTRDEIARLFAGCGNVISVRLPTESVVADDEHAQHQRKRPKLEQPQTADGGDGDGGDGDGASQHDHTYDPYCLLDDHHDAEGASATVTETTKPRLDEKVCFDFARGQCSRGDRCLYSHAAANAAAARTSGGAGTCYDFQFGTCTRGASCKYTHVMAGDVGGGSCGAPKRRGTKGGAGDDGKSRRLGYGYVIFSGLVKVKEAMSLNGTLLRGRRLTVGQHRASSARASKATTAVTSSGGHDESDDGGGARRGGRSRGGRGRGGRGRGGRGRGGRGRGAWSSIDGPAPSAVGGDSSGGAAFDGGGGNKRVRL